jgi:hypothetical protein
MKKFLFSFILINLFSISIFAQKTANDNIYVIGVPSTCIYGKLYINASTGDIYSYKTSVGCVLSGSTTSVSGTGTSGRVAYWNGTSSISSTSGFTFSSNNLSIPTGGQFQINGTAFNFSNLAGNIAVSQMNSGTGADATTFFRGDGTWQVVTSGANTALSNLASVSINTALLFQTGLDIGSTIKPARDLYLVGNGTYGTNYFRFTGTPTSTRVLTLQDGNYSIAGIDFAQTWTANQTYGSGILRTTLPQITTGINDSNGNELWKFTATSSAVNELTLANAAIGNRPTISASGDDSNIDIGLTTKGSGIVFISSGLTVNNGTFNLGNGSSTKLVASNTVLRLASDGTFGFSSNTNAGAAGADIGLARNAAGVVEVNNGTAGIYRDLKLRQIFVDSTYTASGTTGAQTINKQVFSVNFAASATTLVVTNSLVAATSGILCTVNTNDTTMKTVLAVPASGSLTITSNAAATAETRVTCMISN